MLKFTNPTCTVIFPTDTSFEILPSVLPAMYKFTNLYARLLLLLLCAWKSIVISAKHKLTDHKCIERCFKSYKQEGNYLIDNCLHTDKNDLTKLTLTVA